jgi:hypothetical protein
MCTACATCEGNWFSSCFGGFEDEAGYRDNLQNTFITSHPSVKMKFHDSLEWETVSQMLQSESHTNGRVRCVILST